MPNTFLNTGRTVAATSNPVNNVNQVSNNPINQVQTQQTAQVPNTQAQAGQSNSAINPITIPIQIQPQIASMAPAQSNTTNVQTLQTNNTQQANAAPTPQTYNANNTNNNVVDFNQIYSSYQSQYGNNNQSTNNTGTSGIKKTSLGTTIVTPTTSNINSVQGQYQSAYSDTINSLISQIASQVQNGFQYDPANDTALQMATEYAANSTLQSLAGSGVLNSSATAERVARVVSELIPQYEQLAYTRWSDGLSRLADTAQLVMQYDSQQFEYWKDAKDREFQNKQFEYQKAQDELENAWKRVDELGYVDNEASAVLGVPVGTLSGEARLAKEEREYELARMREQYELERANDEALYKLRAELDKEYADYEYQLVNKYGTSTSNGSGSSGTSSNYSRYDEIIKNAFATQDMVDTNKYYIDGQEQYDKFVDYLDGLYSTNQISYQDYTQLLAKYSNVRNGSSSSSTTTTSTSAGLTDENKSTWIKALDGNNSALNQLGVTIYGQKKSNVNNNDAKKAVEKALEEIKNGTYTFTNNQDLMTALKNGEFGKLGWGL